VDRQHGRLAGRVYFSFSLFHGGGGRRRHHRVCAHPCIRAHTHARSHARTFTGSHTHARTRTNARAHTHARTHAHTHTHTPVSESDGVALAEERVGGVRLVVVRFVHLRVTECNGM
jgi:hypothetical protein